MKATRKMKCSAKAAALSVVMAMAAWGLPAAEGVSRADGKDKVRVACIGDSITWGYAMTNRVAECYPAQLQRLLGPDYDVRNFGDPGAGVYSRPKANLHGWTEHTWRPGANGSLRREAFRPFARPAAFDALS